jgi:hypothetical protein
LVSWPGKEPAQNAEGQPIIRPTVHLLSEDRVGFQMRPDITVVDCGTGLNPVIETASGQLYYVNDPDIHLLKMWHGDAPKVIELANLRDPKELYEEDQKIRIQQREAVRVLRPESTAQPQGNQVPVETVR